MSQAVVVFSFPEPKESITLGLIIESAKKSFANMNEVKIYLAINEVADNVLSIFDPLSNPDSNLVEHAKRELSLINNDDDFNNAIINAVRIFASYGHSGGSASVAIPILIDLLQFKNLAPLTDDPKEWIHHTDEKWGEPGGIWQSTRNSEAFSKDGGKTYYLLSEGSISDHPNNTIPPLAPYPLHNSVKHIKE